MRQMHNLEIRPRVHVGVRLSGHRLAGYEGGEVRVIFHEVHMPVSDGSHGARRAFMVLERIGPGIQGMYDWQPWRRVQQR